MVRAGRLRLWSAIHRWTSLACTIFLLVACLTGLLLLFGDEIDAGFRFDMPASAALPGELRINLDGLVAASLRQNPGYVVTGLFADDEAGAANVFVAPSWREARSNPGSVRVSRFDLQTGIPLSGESGAVNRHTALVAWTLTLHRSPFGGSAGMLIMGITGVLFVVAVISGVVLYGPFTRKLDFGEIRRHRTRRIYWLDIHNLLGVTTLVWAIVVGATGVFNQLSGPLFAHWQKTAIAGLSAPRRGLVPPEPAELASLQGAFDAAKRASPGTVAISAIFPGGSVGSPHHYLVFTQGDTPLTSRLFTAVLIDARTDALTAVVHMPWYLNLLQTARPLHFGDYGSLPLKIIWVLFDIVTIGVLLSGLYLWLAKLRDESFAVDTMNGPGPEDRRSVSAP